MLLKGTSEPGMAIEDHWVIRVHQTTIQNALWPRTFYSEEINCIAQGQNCVAGTTISAYFPTKPRKCNHESSTNLYTIINCNITIHPVWFIKLILTAIRLSTADWQINAVFPSKNLKMQQPRCNNYATKLNKCCSPIPTHFIILVAWLDEITSVEQL